jgi:hypothetical protein
MYEMNRVELYSLITISLTICLGGYSNADAGAGAGGSSWGCGGDVSWVDIVIIVSNSVSILWMLVLLIVGGKSELVNQGRRLRSMICRSQNATTVQSLENPLSLGSTREIELSELIPSALAITKKTLLETDNSEAVTEKLSAASVLLLQTSETMKAVVSANSNLDLMVTSKAAALVEEIGSFLLEGSSHQVETDQEKDASIEEDRQQLRHEDDIEHGEDHKDDSRSIDASHRLDTLPPAPSAGAMVSAEGDDNVPDFEAPPSDQDNGKGVRGWKRLANTPAVKIKAAKFGTVEL